MLSKNEEDILISQLKMVFENFIDTDRIHLVDAIIRLSVDSVKLVCSLEQLLLEAPDDASCGPAAAAAPVNAGSEVLCPHCNKLF